MNSNRVKVRNFFLILLPFVLIGGFFFFLGYTRKPPKEAQLLQNFNEHRAAFEQLRDLLLADEQLSRVAPWGVDISKPFFLGFPSEQNFPMVRFKRYLALLKETGGKVAFRHEGQHPDPSIIVWAWGWAGTSRHISICWLDQAPTNQIPTLDGYFDKSVYPNRQTAYKHIDSNWWFWTDL